jgi:D-aminopeptidase
MTGQAGPHVYISADMEGITGLVDAQDVQPGGADYDRGRVMMTEDVNAAIGGVHAAWGEGTGITVNDAHGPMRNILPELLHPAARLIRGKPKPMGMLAGLDGSHDAVICVGYHARAGALGVLSHSFMGHEIDDIWLNGRPGRGDRPGPGHRGRAGRAGGRAVRRRRRVRGNGRLGPGGDDRGGEARGGPLRR